MDENVSGKISSHDVCWECTQSCCRGAKPPLTNERMTKIEEFLKTRERPAEPIFTYSEFKHPSVDSDDFCVFYEKLKKKCMIHEVKPETCRAGPVTFDINIHTKKIEWFLKESELCTLAGKLFKNTGKFNEHLSVAKEEIMRLVRELDAEALRAILRRDEPETFKIGEDALPKKVLAKLCLQ